MNHQALLFFSASPGIVAQGVSLLSALDYRVTLLIQADKLHLFNGSSSRVSVVSSGSTGFMSLSAMDPEVVKELSNKNFRTAVIPTRQPDISFYSNLLEIAYSLGIEDIIQVYDSRAVPVKRSHWLKEALNKRGKEYRPPNLPIMYQFPEIILPLFGSYHIIEQALNSAIENAGMDFRFTVILNDKYNRKLKNYARALGVKHENLRLIVNKENNFFLGGANEIMNHTRHAYVLLLNEDVILPRDWLKNMMAAMNSHDRIGMVTPLVNLGNATRLDLPPGINFFEASRWICQNSQKIYPDITAAEGFCLLLKTRMLDEIGLFDRIFYPGYGEETYLHMEAVKAGWRSVADDSTYVFHYDSQSFMKEEKKKLIHRAVEIINLRTGFSFREQVREFNKKNPLEELQKKVNTLTPGKEPGILLYYNGDRPETKRNIIELNNYLVLAARRCAAAVKKDKKETFPSLTGVYFLDQWEEEGIINHFGKTIKINIIDSPPQRVPGLTGKNREWCLEIPMDTCNERFFYARTNRNKEFPILVTYFLDSKKRDLEQIKSQLFRKSHDPIEIDVCKYSYFGEIESGSTCEAIISYQGLPAMFNRSDVVLFESAAPHFISLAVWALQCNCLPLFFEGNDFFPTVENFTPGYEWIKATRQRLKKCIKRNNISGLKSLTLKKISESYP